MRRLKVYGIEAQLQKECSQCRYGVEVDGVWHCGDLGRMASEDPKITGHLCAWFVNKESSLNE